LLILPAQYDPQGGSLIFMHRNSFKLNESEGSQQRIWQALVEHQGEAESYWGHVWMPVQSDNFAVGKEACYGPPNTTDGFRRLSIPIDGSGIDGSSATQGIADLETELLSWAAEASRMIPSRSSPPTAIG
jgi:hypothetical protein